MIAPSLFASATLRINLVNGKSELTADGDCPEKKSVGKSNRWFGTTNDILAVLVFSGQTVEVEYDEQPRVTRFAEDLKIAKEISKRLGAGPPEWRPVEPKVLTRKRANLVVSVRDVTAPKDAEPLMVVTVVTGPPEHAFLSGDLPINSVSQHKRDTSGNIVVKKMPKEFMLGLDYSVGDIRSDPGFWGDGLQLKP